MRPIARFLDTLGLCERIVASLALFIAALALLSDIFAREIFQVGLFGSFRVAVYATATAALLGFNICVAQGGHLRISFLDTAAPAAVRPLVIRIGQFVSAAICFYFLYWAVIYVDQTRLLRETDSSLHLLVWPMQAVLPWMFFSSGLRFLCYGLFPSLTPAEAEIVQ